MSSRGESPTGEAAALGGRHALLAAVRAELVERGHAAVSLRAVARRAGLSHAAPKHHFTDRAGMLTAAATEGFTELAAALRAADAADAADGPGRLARLGQVYLEFGLANPALFDLMFRPSELTADDPALRAASAAAVGVLAGAVTPSGAPDPAPRGPAGVPPLALISWVFVHGLVVLTGDGALAAATGTDAAADLARALTRDFARRVG